MSCGTSWVWPSGSGNDRSSAEFAQCFVDLLFGAEPGRRLTQSTTRRESFVEHVGYRTCHEFLAEPVGRRLGDRACRPGHAVPLLPLDVIIGNILPVKYDRIRPLAETGWYGQVHTGGVDIAETVQGEGRVVADYGAPAAPQMPADQVIVVRGGPVSQAEQPMIDSLPVAVVHVILLGLVAEALVASLARGEIALLECREVQQGLPYSTSVRRHALRVTQKTKDFF